MKTANGTRVIAHVDMDAFFAAIEQRDSPAYMGRAVIVGADPKGGRGRGVVSTCSYEARSFGIHSAMPISIAFRRCPDAIFLPVDMKKYIRVSEQVFNILMEFTPTVEQVSIDEAFLDITHTYKLFGTALNTAASIKSRIKKETGLTASVGLAPTKMAAKIASGLKKPDGLVEVKPEGLLDFLRPLDVGLLWGVGAKTKAVLNRIGIHTIGDLAARKRLEIADLFGKNGEWLWTMAQGIDESGVETEREIKSMSNETTFETDTAECGSIMTALSSLCEEVSGRLRDEKFKCRTITLKIRLGDFTTYTRAHTVEEPTNYSEVMMKTVRRLFEDFDLKGRKVRLVGVRASNLSAADERTLFPTREETKKEDIHRAVDKIRHKFGSDAIIRASSR